MRRALLLCLCLAACDRFPDLSSALTPEAKAAPYPALQSLDPVLTQADATADRTAEIEKDTAAQIARADALGAR